MKPPSNRELVGFEDGNLQKPTDTLKLKMAPAMSEAGSTSLWVKFGGTLRNKFFLQISHFFCEQSNKLVNKRSAVKFKRL